MAANTKERILDAALDMMSRNGYAATNIRKLSQSLGLSKAAMYRHFSGKEDLLHALLDRLEDYYRTRFSASGNLTSLPVTGEELTEATLRMVDFTIHDEKIVKVRRFLLTEQFRNDTVRSLATRYFLTSTQEIFTAVFTAMTEAGTVKKCDPAMLAFAYTTPITSLIHLCDREPEREKEIMDRLRAWIAFFLETYGA